MLTMETIPEEKETTEIETKDQETKDENKKAEFDPIQILKMYVSECTAIYSHLESFNCFLEKIKDIIEKSKEITVTDRKDLKRLYKFNNVYIRNPTISENTERQRLLYPDECRLRNLTYASEILSDITEVFFDEEDRVCENKVHNQIKICELPIILNCDRCNLSKLNKDERIEKKECEFDVGGYFIIKGKEKILIAQERLLTNIPFVFSPQKAADKKKYRYSCEIRCVTERGIKPNIVSVKLGMDNRNVTVNVNGSEDIPCALLFYALGITDDSEIIELIYPEIYKNHDQNMVTRIVQMISQAKIYKYKDINDSVGPFLNNIPRDNYKVAVNSMIMGLFPHLDNSIKIKRLYLGYLIRLLFDVARGVRKEDDRDSFCNKRIDTTGKLMEDIFRDSWEKYNTVLIKALKSHPGNISEFTKCNIITTSITSCLATGNWSIKKTGYMKKGVSQLLNRVSYLAFLSHMFKVTSTSGKEGKSFWIRQLHGSQFNYIDPAESPEGIPCGLVKHMSIGTHITVDKPNINLIGLIKTKIITIDDADIKDYDKTKVFVNGNWLGYITNPEEFKEYFVKQRSNGSIDHEISISYRNWDNIITIFTDGGRLSRPLITVKDQIPAIKDMSSLEVDWTSNLLSGRIVYLDNSEIETVITAVSIKDIIYPETKYAEITPAIMFGVVSSIIPFPDHVQSVRNAYACSMAKQALSIYCTTFLERFDTLGYILNTTQKPLVSNKMSEIFGYNELGAGLNAIVAILCTQKSLNMEDGILVKKGFADRGGFASTVYKTVSSEEKSQGNQHVETIGIPSQKLFNEARNYMKLDDKGVIEVRETRISSNGKEFHPNTPVRKNDIIIAKTIYKDGVQSDASEYQKSDEVGYVDKVLTTTNSTGNKLVKVRVRYPRGPIVGSKLASRQANKSIISRVVPDEDMPFTVDGMSPDLIINPNSLPSRMLQALLLEIILGKYGALAGKIMNATPFEANSKPESFESFIEDLKKYGFTPTSKEVMYSGTTGKELGLVAIGPIYYQALKHMIEDKLSARDSGPVQILTRQPANNGRKSGLEYTSIKVGTMERDAFISHGAANIIRERMLISSDKYDAPVCSNCGLISTNCCGPIIRVTIPYPLKLLFQELMAMGVAPRIRV